MLAFITFIFIAAFVLGLPGIPALLCCARGDVRNKSDMQLMRVERNELRDENRMLKVNAKHTKAAWNLKRRVDAALRAITKVRDERRDEADILDNAAEHIAAIVRGD